MTVKPGYECLNEVLMSALAQASDGKGHERHASDAPFDEQVTCWINRQPGMTYAVGQAVKKVLEACKMVHDGVADGEDRAEAEYLGAINYLAAEIITMKKNTVKVEPTPPCSYALKDRLDRINDETNKKIKSYHRTRGWWW